MTRLPILFVLVLVLLVPAAFAEDQPDFFRVWTIEKPLCPGHCGKFTLDYVTGFVGKQIDVGRDWFTNDIYESCRRGAHYDDIKPQDTAKFLEAYKVKPASLGIRQKSVWAGRVFCSDHPIATLIYLNDKQAILVFEQGVFVPLK
jgi:hypothetical protein